MASNDWNLMAGLALEQILERNENGNLYPLTSLEIGVITDIKEMLIPDEKEQEDPVPVPPVVPQKPVGKQPDPKIVVKKKGFVPLNQKDLTG
jgi:hypothetical protein